MTKVIFSISASIFLTIFMFFVLYLMSYFIVWGALFTFKKIKDKWNEYNLSDNKNENVNA